MPVYAGRSASKGAPRPDPRRPARRPPPLDDPPRDPLEVRLGVALEKATALANVFADSIAEGASDDDAPLACVRLDVLATMQPLIDEVGQLEQLTTAPDTTEGTPSRRLSPA